MRQRTAGGLLLFLLVLGAARAAGAAVDLTQVTFQIAGVRAAGVISSLTATVTVQGDHIVSATLEAPGVGTSPVPIPASGADFVLVQTFASEQDLGKAFPDGTYQLTLNGSTVVKLDFARPAVASPAITAPSSGVILRPGPVTVAFSPCLACTESTDSTEATLVDSTSTVLADELLGSNADTWTPSDGGGPLALPADGSFTATIVEKALRTSPETGPSNDAFDFVTDVSESDSVSFFTGAAPPSGSFCVVVADDPADPLDPGGECDAPDAPSGALLDPSGSFPAPVAGIDIEVDEQVLPSGKITGTALADLDGNGSLESSAPLSGKVGGQNGKVHRNLGFAFRSTAPAAKLSVKIKDESSVVDGEQGGTIRASGTVNGAKVKGEAPSALPAGPSDVLGWRLDVSLADDHSASGSVTLRGGRTIDVRGNWSFDFTTGLSTIDLESKDADAGTDFRLGQLVLDDTDPAAPVITAGHLRYHILGQGARLELP